MGLKRPMTVQPVGKALPQGSHPPESPAKTGKTALARKLLC